MSLDFNKIIAEPKTWVMTFKVKGKGLDVRRPEYLTESKALIVRKFLHDPKSRFIDLTDDNGNCKETIEKREIESVAKISEAEKEDMSGDKRWVCSYGTRHRMTEGSYTGKDGTKQWSELYCGCREKFGVSSMELLEWCSQFKGVEHAHQITPKMQDEFLRSQSLKGIHN